MRIIEMPTKKIVPVNSSQFFFLRDRMLISFDDNVKVDSETGGEWTYEEFNRDKVARMIDNLSHESVKATIKILENK